MELVRQAMFNTLGGLIQGAAVLDLYAGGGSLGIEALSRGARSCLFVEQSQQGFGCLRRNTTGLEGAELIRGDVRRVLPRLRGRRFDLILMDPPYGRGLVNVTIALCSRFELLNASGRLVVEHSSSEPVETAGDWIVLRSARYGRSSVTIVGRR